MAAFEQETSVNQLQEFLGVLKKRRWQILLPAVFVLAIGSVYAVIVPKKYEVTTRVELKETRTERDYQYRNPQETAIAREVQNARYHLQHYQRVQEVIEEQGELWDDYVMLDDSDRNDFVKQVMSSVEVNVLPKPSKEGSTFVDIAYSDVDGVRAERFLTNIRGKWLEGVADRDLARLKDEKESLQNQVEKAREHYQNLNAHVVTLRNRMGIDPTLNISGSVQRQGDPVFRELEEARARRAALEIEIARAETVLADLTERHAKEPAEVPEVIDVPGLDLSDARAELQLQIKALKGKQEKLTPRNSTYKRIEADIRDLEAQIAEARRLEVEDTTRTEMRPNEAKLDLAHDVKAKGTELAGMRRELLELSGSIADLDGRVTQRQNDYGELQVLTVQTSIAEQDLTKRKSEYEDKVAALGVYMMAKLPYEVVQEPFAPPEPTDPNPWILVGFSLFAGLALGLLYAMVAEYGRNSYRTVHELTRVMTVPVLGSINTIVTRSEERRVRARHAVVAASTTVILGGLAWLTWTWANAPDRLPVEVVQAIEGLRLKLM